MEVIIRAFLFLAGLFCIALVVWSFIRNAKIKRQEEVDNYMRDLEIKRRLNDIKKL